MRQLTLWALACASAMTVACVDAGAGDDSEMANKAISCNGYGYQLAFVSNRTGTSRIWIADPDGANQVVLTTPAQGEDGEPRWSPNGMRLAVRRGFSIGSVNKYGSSWRLLSSNPSDIDLDPQWSPDGVWVTYRAWGSGLYRANASELNPNPVNLTAGDPAPPIDHAWSPDSSRIAYVTGAGLWVMDLSGNDKLQLTQGAQVVSAPAWSPDGTQIAYITNAGPSGWPNVWIMNADGTDAHAVTNGSHEEFEPSWFPSGDRLLFGRTTGTGRDLFAINADGTGAVNLTPTDGDDYQAEISPDGEYIAWASNRYDGNYEVFTMRADATEVERVTHTKAWATDSDPTWRICN